MNDTNTSMPGSCLRVIVYHYVRDLPNTAFPRIKGMLTSAFREQVRQLSNRHEMATLESALAFLAGAYQPKRDLCLLTFDDGLKDHYTDVLPVLCEKGLQGVFFMPTLCLEEQRVLSVHKNHFLMALLDFDEYRYEFLRRLMEISPETETTIDLVQAQSTYWFDTPEVAAFKYLLNFRLPDELREHVLDSLFACYLGEESRFARQLYVSWREAREMQAAGMIVGGHSHKHLALATLSDDAQKVDLETCTRLLHGRLHPQQVWPFSCPYGGANSFNGFTLDTIRDLGFACSFTTEVGANEPRQDVYRIRRIDTSAVSGQWSVVSARTQTLTAGH